MKLRTVLDNVMKEHAAQNIGMTCRQAQYISPNFELKLWQEKVLGEENPDQLHDTATFLIGINVGLRGGDEHFDLRCESEKNPSQITIKRDSNGDRCMVYQEDSIANMNDGGLSSTGRELLIRSHSSARFCFELSGYSN